MFENVLYLFERGRGSWQENGKFLFVLQAGLAYMVAGFGALSWKQHNVRVIRAAKPVCRRMTERGKVLNTEYSINRDQPTSGASPLRINTLLSGDLRKLLRA